MCRTPQENAINGSNCLGKTSNGNNLFDIESYNVRGIRTYKRRCDFTKWLKDRKNVDMAILVDTHCRLPREARQWGKLWSQSEDDSYWSYGTKNRKGVTILLNPKLRDRAKILKVDKDSNGRYIKIILEIGGSKYRIVGVYAPNDSADRINFILKLKTVVLIDDYDAENIVGGDHNLAMDDKLDRINCVSKHNDKGRIDMLYLTQKHDLEDIFRTRYPDKKQYTYFKNDENTGQASRIDYWLTSISLNNQIEVVDSHYNPYSDHHGIKLVFRTNETKVGKGLYKINVSNVISCEFKQQFEEMWNEWRQSKTQYEDINKWWDLGKRKIKNLAKDFSYEKSLELKQKLRI